MKNQQLSKRFISRGEATEIAAEIQNLFLVGDLNSRSRVPQVAQRVAEHLRDEGVTPKRSLCLMIAKMALTMWIETTVNVKSIHASN